MHVCTLPQSPVHIVGGQRRSAWYHGLPRWRPSKVISSRPATPLRQGLPVRSPKRSRHFESQTMARTTQNGGDQRLERFDRDKKLLEEKASLVEVSELEVKPLLDPDEYLFSSPTECLPQKRSLKTRFRIRRLLRSQRSPQSLESKAPEKDSPSSSRNKKQSSGTRKSRSEDASGNQRGSSMNSMAYHIAVGLAWSMPAPFDMMPTGYPTRLF
ncbi:hypothetical protein BDP55DRAFT_722941 [Colletotrichum godetiae]|uniref:Uncharacterized protein n=1 Tax=Colletotrichum godetiae TaxID=1209918 RepID=A0AAJ0B2C4_9PEZI|nr:uncharacterized protein BDP55DRAFT_722941 [Colletotrichum godetiae]KAK1700402.1 hypothetical protein BDP55DRAFT_722941 [Colletotrichum godetiae]